MGCKYYKNGVESKLYTELFGYMDDVSPEKKSVENVYKILKKNGIATRNKGGIYGIRRKFHNEVMNSILIN